jgi:hypothetical protein
MVVLEHGSVVVQKGKRRLGVHEENVVDSRMINVMNDSG